MPAIPDPYQQDCGVAATAEEEDECIHINVSLHIPKRIAAEMLEQLSGAADAIRSAENLLFPYDILAETENTLAETILSRSQCSHRDRNMTTREANQFSDWLLRNEMAK